MSYAWPTLTLTLNFCTSLNPKINPYRKSNLSDHFGYPRYTSVTKALQQMIE